MVNKSISETPEKKIVDQIDKIDSLFADLAVALQGVATEITKTRLWWFGDEIRNHRIEVVQHLHRWQDLWNKVNKARLALEARVRKE